MLSLSRFRRTLKPAVASALCAALVLSSVEPGLAQVRQTAVSGGQTVPTVQLQPVSGVLPSLGSALSGSLPGLGSVLPEGLRLAPRVGSIAPGGVVAVGVPPIMPAAAVAIVPDRTARPLGALSLRGGFDFLLARPLVLGFEGGFMSLGKAEHQATAHGAALGLSKVDGAMTYTFLALRAGVKFGGKSR